MDQRINIATGTKWELSVGYSRAVRIGANVYVSGTTATNEEGKIIGHGNPYLQTVKAIKNIEGALEEPVQVYMMLLVHVSISQLLTTGKK